MCSPGAAPRAGVGVWWLRWPRVADAELSDDGHQRRRGRWCANWWDDRLWTADHAQSLVQTTTSRYCTVMYCTELMSVPSGINKSVYLRLVQISFIPYSNASSPTDWYSQSLTTARGSVAVQLLIRDRLRPRGLPDGRTGCRSAMTHKVLETSWPDGPRPWRMENSTRHSTTVPQFSRRRTMGVFRNCCRGRGRKHTTYFSPRLKQWTTTIGG